VPWAGAGEIFNRRILPAPSTPRNLNRQRVSRGQPPAPLYQPRCAGRGGRGPHPVSAKIKRARQTVRTPRQTSLSSAASKRRNPDRHPGARPRESRAAGISRLVVAGYSRRCTYSTKKAQQPTSLPGPQPAESAHLSSSLIADHDHPPLEPDRQQFPSSKKPTRPGHRWDPGSSGCAHHARQSRPSENGAREPRASLTSRYLVGENLLDTARPLSVPMRLR